MLLAPSSMFHAPRSTPFALRCHLPSAISYLPALAVFAVSGLIAPLASARFIGTQSSASPALIIGTARIHANVRLSAYATITGAGTRATVYPAGQARNAAFPIRQAGSEVQNGVALLNTTNQTATVTLAFVNSVGEEVARISRQLAGSEQLSRFIDEFYPEIRNGGFSGTVIVRSTVAIAVVALQIDRSGITTIPVTLLD